MADTRPAPAPGSRAAQKAQTRARILQCALDAFAARGFDGTTLRDVASAAGVQHGLLRHHFGDKDGLWRAAVDFLFARLDEETGNTPDEASLPPVEQAKARLRRYVRYCARHPEHARIMMQESVSPSHRLDWAVDKHIRPDHEARWAHLKRFVGEGVYPDVPLASLTYMLVAMAQMPFVLAPEVEQIYGADPISDAFVEAHAEAIVKLIFDHPARPA